MNQWEKIAIIVRVGTCEDCVWFISLFIPNLKIFHLYTYGHYYGGRKSREAPRKPVTMCTETHFTGEIWKLKSKWMQICIHFRLPRWNFQQFYKNFSLWDYKLPVIHWFRSTFCRSQIFSNALIQTSSCNSDFSKGKLKYKKIRSSYPAKRRIFIWCTYLFIQFIFCHMLIWIVHWNPWIETQSPLLKTCLNSVK